MSLMSETKPAYLADLLRRLGGIPPERIRLNPAPGTATERDLKRAGKPTCELIDGVLVEKAMGDAESMLGNHVSRLIGNYVEEKDLGVVIGEGGFIKIRKGLVRAPDATFIPWSSMPGGELPPDAYWSVAPGLIVEVLSRGNRRGEIDRKLREFFWKGCALAWVIDPKTKTAKVYTSPTDFTEHGPKAVLDASPILPEFKLSLSYLFGKLTPRKKS